MNLSKKIYIVLSQSGSIPSRVLKFFTHDEYNHVSISLTPTLETMYSFGRRYIQFPFPGGFTEECVNGGVLKYFPKTKIKIIEIRVEESKYNLFQAVINYFIHNKKTFKYNYFGVFVALFKINFRQQKRFYCSQFVKTCLDILDFDGIENLPEVTKPINFLKLKNGKVIYTGLLSAYLRTDT